MESPYTRKILRNFVDGVISTDFRAVESHIGDMTAEISGLIKRTYYVDPEVSTAFPTIESAVNAIANDIPQTEPAGIGVIATAPGKVHAVDMNLPNTHSFFFYEPGYPGIYTSNHSGIIGRLGTTPFDDVGEARRLQIGFQGVNLGSQAGVLALEPRYGWRMQISYLLLYTASINPIHDAGITDVGSAIILDVVGCRMNNSFTLQYQNPAKTTPSTQISFVNCPQMLATPSATPAYVFDTRIQCEFQRCNLIGLGAAGSIFEGANSPSGNITFQDCYFEYITIGTAYRLFGADFGNVDAEWTGITRFGEIPIVPAAVDFQGVASHLNAPVIIGPTAPINRPVGTRRTDQGGTETELFWNGAAWV
jgi:hypothetical protein